RFRRARGEIPRHVIQECDHGVLGPPGAATPAPPRPDVRGWRGRAPARVRDRAPVPPQGLRVPPARPDGRRDRPPRGGPPRGPREPAGHAPTESLISGPCIGTLAAGVG